MRESTVYNHRTIWVLCFSCHLSQSRQYYDQICNKAYDALHFIRRKVPSISLIALKKLLLSEFSEITIKVTIVSYTSLNIRTNSKESCGAAHKGGVYVCVCNQFCCAVCLYAFWA